MAKFYISSYGPSLDEFDIGQNINNANYDNDLNYQNKISTATNNQQKQPKKKKKHSTQTSTQSKPQQPQQQQITSNSALSQQKISKKKKKPQSQPITQPQRSSSQLQSYNTSKQQPLQSVTQQVVTSNAVQEKKKKKKRSSTSGLDYPAIELGYDQPAIELDIPVTSEQSQVPKKKKKRVHSAPVNPAVADLPQRQSTPFTGLLTSKTSAIQPFTQAAIELSMIEQEQPQKHKKKRKSKKSSENQLTTPFSAATFFQKERSPSIFHDTATLIASNSSQNALQQNQSQITQLQGALQQAKLELELEQQKNLLYQKQLENKAALDTSFSRQAAKEELDDQRVMTMGKETNQLFDLLMKQIKLEVQEIKNTINQSNSVHNSQAEKTSTEPKTNNESEQNKIEKNNEEQSKNKPESFTEASIPSEVFLRKPQQDPLDKQKQLHKDILKLKQQSITQTKKQKMLYKLQQLIQESFVEGDSSLQFDQTDLDALEVLPESQLESFVEQLTSKKNGYREKKQQESLNQQIDQLRQMILEINNYQKEEQRIQLELMNKMIQANTEKLKEQINNIISNHQNSSNNFFSPDRQQCQQQQVSFHPPIQQMYPGQIFNPGTGQSMHISQIANPYFPQMDLNMAIGILARSTNKYNTYIDNKLRFLFADMGISSTQRK